MSDDRTTQPPAYDALTAYWGDIHNHCDISYGHGSLEDALTNARAQLDFTSVTAHAHWPDLPQDDERLAAVNAYHRQGFALAKRNWPHYRETMNAANEDDRFVTLLSFEWHSLLSGDHNIYYRSSDGEILEEPTLEAMRERLRALKAAGTDALLIPHHIGYKQGYRGINWSQFTEEFSPIAEIYSMHGCAESDEAPWPYLHTMGPVDAGSTFQHGLAMGNIVGAYGSTDSHSAHPGSHGHGRMGVWARDLTRDGIWDAIINRRTVALTGDNMRIAFAVNDAPIGSVVPFTEDREIDIAVTGAGSLDYVELLHNTTVIERWNVLAQPGPDVTESKVRLELGWGEGMTHVDWDVALDVENGCIRDVEPHFRGWDIVSPQQDTADRFTFSGIDERTDRHIAFHTRSWPNPTTTTPGTQAITLHVDGDANTTIRATINGHEIEHTLAELADGARSGYMGGFLTPAWRFHKLAPASDFRMRAHTTHRSNSDHDWYSIRARQRNNQWAWSSPIWVTRRSDAM